MGRCVYKWVEEWEDECSSDFAFKKIDRCVCLIAD
jgi:hypothetical protein